jgi:hypothetical protein
VRFFLQTGNIGVLLLEVGVDAGRYRALAKSEPNEEKQTCPSHKTSDITNAPNRYPSSSKNSNVHLRGWANYFSKGYPAKAFRHLNHYVGLRVSRHPRRRSQRAWRLPKDVSLYEYLHHRLGLI